MNFFKIEDEINYFQKMYLLKKEIEDYLHLAGFMYIEPSIFESYDDFVSINSRLDNKTMVKLIDNNSKIQILSPDITTGIVNKFLPKWEENLKLKIFYYGKTYKHNTVGIKENREIGVEIIGEKTDGTDEKAITVSTNIMKKYSKEYLLEIGNSKFLKGIMQSLDLEKDDYNKVMSLLYSKNKQELRSFVSTLNYKEGMSTLINILDLEGSIDDVLKALKGLYLNNLMKKAIEELKNIDSCLKNITSNVTYDLSMVSELSYYDGIIFRGYVPSSNKTILKGGRYDSFTQQYGKKIPAVGFTIDIDELLKVLYREESKWVWP